MAATSVRGEAVSNIAKDWGLLVGLRIRIGYDDRKAVHRYTDESAAGDNLCLMLADV